MNSSGRIPPQGDSLAGRSMGSGGHISTVLADHDRRVARQRDRPVRADVEQDEVAVDSRRDGVAQRARVRVAGGAVGHHAGRRSALHLSDVRYTAIRGMLCVPRAASHAVAGLRALWCDTFRGRNYRVGRTLQARVALVPGFF